jgi:hypothetical protein
MKRATSLALAVIIATASLGAQALGGPGRQGSAQAATITKAEGTLALVNGMIALKTKDNKVLYLMGLQHLIGFIDGLKEGASVKVEGYGDSLRLAPEYTLIRLTKLSFNGRDFDLGQFGTFGGPGFNGGRGRGMMDGAGPGRDGPGMMGGFGGPRS